MRNKNTMSHWEYAWENLFWTVIIFFLYRSIFFCPIWDWSYELSLIFLAGIVMMGAGAGMLLTWKKRRNYVSLFTNVVSSYGIYFVISFWDINRLALLWTGVIAAVFSAIYLCLVLASYIWDRKQHRVFVSWWRCIGACLLNSRTLVISVLSVLLISTAIKPLLGLPLMEAPENNVVAEVSASNDDGETIADNMDTLLLLQEDQWSKLDVAARLNVMKTIGDIEANHLGIPAVDVCAEVLDKTTMGHYNDTTRTITLNLSRLISEDGYTMAETVCHEAYHAYQHRIVDVYNNLDAEARELLIFFEASKYKYEFANYIDGEEDYYAYYAQWCESDSRDYAQQAVEEYHYRINKYIENTNRKEIEP